MKAQDITETNLTYNACRCGTTHTIKAAKHYDRFLLSCGERVWALRPQRDAKLKLVRYPDPQPGERYEVR